MDAARARNDSDAVRTFQSVAAKSGVEDDGTLGYAEHGERSEACQSFLCPLLFSRQKRPLVVENTGNPRR